MNSTNIRHGHRISDISDLKSGLILGIQSVASFAFRRHHLRPLADALVQGRRMGNRRKACAGK